LKNHPQSEIKMSDNYGGEGAPLSYNKYLKVRELTDLQDCLSCPAQHDELLFIVIHQTYELWFKQILHEIDRALDKIKENRLFLATRSLRRVNEIETILASQLVILETMTPHDFLLFRNQLNPASGFQSSQFREIEFASGAKSDRVLESFRHEEFAFERLQKRFGEPSLYDLFFEKLAEHGFDVSSREGRVNAVVEILSAYEQHAELFELQETLMEHDKMIAIWRNNHVLMVERMLGAKQGTGGSEGAGYLRKTLDKRFFPELWEARTHLEIK
jgi:tryptophan 2,3-dioxygenase